MEQDQAFGQYLLKLVSFCNYQERCRREVEEKMSKMGIPSAMQHQLLESLIAEAFFDDQRYAVAFCKGKFHYKKWGRRKIFAALRAKGIGESMIRKALLEIDDKEYRQVLSDLIIKKTDDLGGLSTNENKKKSLNYVLQKGFETHLFWEILNDKTK